MLNFMKNRLWTERLEEKSLLVRQCWQGLRVAVLTFRMYLKNDCGLRSSALTFFTLLSIIPVLALGFAIAKGFGLEERLETWLYAIFKDYPLIAQKMVEFSTNTLQGASGGLIAGVGAIMLFYTTVRLLDQIERSFNQIWGVRVSRSLYRKVSDYLSLILLCPVLIAVNGSMSTFAAAQFAGREHVLPFLADGLMFFSTKLVPFIATWFLFSFIYMYIPNTKVKLFPAFFGGFIAALLYFLVQSIYILAQYFAGKNSLIYGGFAAFPLFLLWLQVSWTIVLFGTQLVYTVQNVREYQGIPLGYYSLGDQRRVVYALRIMKYCAIHFETQGGACPEEEIINEIDIPVLSARQVFSDLVTAKLLSKVNNDDRSLSYQVAFPPERITAAKVLYMLYSRGNEPLGEKDQAAVKMVEMIWKESLECESNIPLSKTSI